MISKDLLLIPGYNKISIININEYNIIKIIDLPNSNSIIGLCILSENIILTGDSNGIIKQWTIDRDYLILTSQKENAHNKNINTLIYIGDGHIASGPTIIHLKYGNNLIFISLDFIISICNSYQHLNQYLLLNMWHK